MRILFCHKDFPGQFGYMASLLASNPANDVRFASMYRRKGASLANVKQIRIMGDQLSAGLDFSETWTASVNAGKARLAYWQSLNKDFKPDLLLYSFCNGVDFFLATAFPETFRVFYAHQFQRSDEMSRALNQIQTIQILQSDLCFAFTKPSETLWAGELKKKILFQEAWFDSYLPEPDPDWKLEKAGQRPILLLDARNYKGGREPLHRFLNHILATTDLFIVCRGLAASELNTKGEYGDRLQLDAAANIGSRLNLFRAAKASLFLGPPSRAMLEAMLCGCPALVPPSRSKNEILDYCLELSGQNVARQAEALKTALAARDQLAVLAEKAQAWVTRQYGAASLVPGHLSLIENARQEWLKKRRMGEAI